MTSVLGASLAVMVAAVHAQPQAASAPGVTSSHSPTVAQADGSSDAQIAQATQRQRAVSWRIQNQADVMNAAWDNAALARAWRDAIRQQPTLAGMVDAVMKARGIASTPPPGWKLPPRKQ